jgi:hypothetical protein
MRRRRYEGEVARSERTTCGCLKLGEMRCQIPVTEYNVLRAQQIGEPLRIMNAVPNQFCWKDHMFMAYTMHLMHKSKRSQNS